MKKILTHWKIIGILLAVLLITAITFVVVYKNQNNDKPIVEEQHTEEVAGDTEVIFSFDSYKEIIGTKPSLVNDFGATVINRDDTYITEGEGSWLIKPQGDYELKQQYPYFRMKCYDSTFITNNFDGYDQVLLDVYNASEDDVDIKWRFRSKTKNGKQNIDTEEITYTLKAGEWTTCEYDLVSALYAVQYDLSDMQYMTIKILSQKEAKEDTVAQLYFDNLRGHLMEGEREEVELTGDFEKVISFEDSTERAYFRNDNSWIPNNNILSRVAYKDTTIKSMDFMGEYVLRGDATASTFPGTTITFDKTYTKGKYLSFMMYIEVDKELVEETGFKTWAVQSQAHIVERAGGPFNKWVQIDIKLKDDCSSLWFFPQFGWNQNLSIFGQNPVTIYMDHFVITDEVKELVVYNFDFEKGITFEKEEEENAIVGSTGSNEGKYLGQWSQSIIALERTKFDGSYTMMGKTNSQFPEIFVPFNKTYKKGSNFTFRYYVEGTVAEDETFIVTMRGYPAGDKAMTTYTVNARKFNRWYETTFTFTEAHDRVSIFIELANTSAIKDGKKVNIYYDDFYINKQNASSIKKFDFEKGVTFEIEEQGEAMVGSSGDNTPRFKNQWSQSVLTLKRKLFDGSYTMAGQTKCQYPEAFVELGKTYPKGTTFTFRYYVEGDEADGETYAVSMRGYPGSEKAFTSYQVSGRKFNRWYETTFTFTEAHDRVAIFMEFGKTGALKDGKSVTIYYDDLYINKQNASSIKVFDFEKGVTFEIEEQDEAMIGSTGDDTTRFKGQWSQSILSLSRKEFDGSYTMMGKTNCQYPEAFVELGKTYPAGTTFTFRYYAKGEVGLTETHKVSVVAYPAGENARTTYEITGNKFNRWNELTITFAEAHDRLALRVELAGTSAIKDGKQAELYFDDLYINKEIDESEVYVPDFETGIDFEDEEQEVAIEGSRGANSQYQGWGQSAITLFRVQYDGSYTMMGETRNQYPEILVNLGKEYPAGTVLTFRVYVEGETTGDTTLESRVRAYAGSSLATTDYDKNLVLNQWNEISVQFTQAHDRFGYYVTLANEAVIDGGKTVNIYYDDFRITKGNTLSFETGVDFENEGDVEAFAASTTGEFTSTLTRELYEESYRLRMNSVNSGGQSPMMTIAFGKTYSVGTKLTFKVKAVNCGTGLQEFYLRRTGKTDAYITTTRGEWSTVTYIFDGEYDSLNILTPVWNPNYTVYFDDFKIETSVDFTEGVDFETLKGVDAFRASTSGENTATLVREMYEESYRLRMNSVNSGGQNPMMTIAFGKAYPIGTKLTFKVKAVNCGTGIQEFYLRRTGKTDAYITSTRDEWTTITYIFDGEYDRLSILTPVWSPNYTVYFDDFKIETSVNFELGVDFETEQGMEAFTASSNGEYTSTLVREMYEESYRLRMNSVNSGGQNPMMTIAFGKAYPIGTKLTFKVKAVNCGTGIQEFYLRRTGKTDAYITSTRDEWTTITYIFDGEYDRLSILTPVWSPNYTLYFDDFSIEVPSN